jgi:hypothetical protein
MYLEKPKGLTIWNVVELKNAAIHDSIFEIKFIWAVLHENPVSNRWINPRELKGPSEGGRGATSNKRSSPSD